jgi:iron complex outermembrane receptor protein
MNNPIHIAIRASLLLAITPMVGAQESEVPVADVEEVVVSTARNRQEANQDVPLPTSVVGSAELLRDNASTATDFARKLPSVSVIQNQPRQSSFAVRGIGKNQNQEAYEGSVGVIIDNVYTVHPGSSWGNFFDLDRIEVARGPQGTLLGKNTTMGVVNVATKTPSFQPSAGVELDYGSRQTLRTTASATGPLAGNWLAYRVSAGYEKGDGPVDNLYKPGETLNDLNRYTARGQLLVRPFAGLSGRVSFDYSRSREFNGAWYVNLADLPAYTNGVARGVIPPSGGATAGSFNYNYSVREARFPGRINTIFGSDGTYASNEMGRLLSQSRGGSAQIDWKFGNGWTATSISAARDYVFRAKNDYDVLDTGFSGGHVQTSQRSQELRLVSPLGARVDYQAGLYYLDVKTTSGNRPGTHYGPDSGAFQATSTRIAGRTYDIFTELNKTAIGRELLAASLNDIYYNSVSKPTSESIASYGQANWHLAPALTLTAGLRFTNEKRTNSSESWNSGGVALTAENFVGSTALERQLATATRTASARSTAYIRGATEDDSVAWLINPSWQVQDDTLLYAVASYGEKSSAVQFLRSGTELNILKPERVRNYEVGIKSLLLDRRLRVNVNVFHTTLKDFQTTVYVPDATTNSGFASFYGNADEVTSKGVELDTVFSPVRNLSFTLVGAYNPARYSDYPNGSCAVEIDPASAPGGCDLTGERVGGSSDLTLAVGVDVRRTLPVWGAELHAFANNSYRSALNVSPSLSLYGRQDGYSVVDVGVGLKFGDGRHDVTLLAKNLFDKRYLISVSDFSNSGVSRAAAGLTRYVGLTYRTSLGN